MKYTLGFSPCPNDTFIFDALVNKKIDTGGIDFDYCLEDVETLNSLALKGKLDITKLSFNAFLQVLPQYILLTSGSALGNGCGPLLIAKEHIPLSEVSACRLAIPGVHTTANMLLSFAFPQAEHRVEMVFSAIEDALLNGKADAGVIIHENRFTYQQKGLVKLIDLGEYWEQKTRCPIPLGGIAVKRTMDAAAQKNINRLIRESVEYAYRQYPRLPPFVTSNAQEMDEAVMRQHIDLYVNQYTVDLGMDGRNAVYILQQEATESRMAADDGYALFID